MVNQPSLGFTLEKYAEYGKGGMQLVCLLTKPNPSIPSDTIVFQDLESSS